MNEPHVLYVGREVGLATRLTTATDGPGVAGLVTVAPEPSVAVTQLARTAVDCVVVECPLPDATVAELRRRIAEVAPDVATVLRLADATAPPVPDEQWDQVCDSAGGTAALTAAISAAVAPDADVPAVVADARDVSTYAARVAPDGVVQRVNTRVADGLDRPETAMVGESLSSLLPASVAERLLAAGQRALSSGTIRELTFEASERHFQAVAIPDEASFEVFVQDVTDARRTERAFHEERAFLDTVVDTLAELFFVLDGSGTLVRWNDRVGEVTGYSDDQLASMDVLEFLVEEDLAAGRAALDEVLETGHATVELRLATTAGEEVPFEFSGSVVRDDDDLPYICAVGRDVSERRRTERERDAAIEELERSNAELEQFAYVASHDLREPLRMISSYLQLLERRYQDSLDEDAGEFIDYAVDGAVRMREMITQLLVYSRIGRRDVSFDLVDCTEVIETVTNDLQVAIEESDAEVTVGDLPTVTGNHHQLVQLFENLLGNAIKYAGDDPPRIEVRASRDGDEWLFAVADNGRGIPREQRDRIFDVFYVGDDRDQTGIGLAIAKKIVERHGGRIRVESTVGEGSTFYVALPESPPPSAPFEAPDDLPTGPE